MKTRKAEERLAVIWCNDERVFPITRSHWARNPYMTYGRTVLAGTLERFYYGEYSYKINCFGDKPFYQGCGPRMWGFKNGKLWMKGFTQIPADILENVLSTFRLEWAIPVTRFLCKYPSLLTKVLKKEITNEKDLYIAFSRRYFKGVYFANVLKEYVHSGQYLDLWTIAAFTTDPNECLIKLIKESSEYDCFSDSPDTQLRQAIKNAKIINEKINPRWSPRRVEEVIRRQDEHLAFLRAADCDDTPLIKVPYTGEDISLILDERTCCWWAEYMHNCMHANYWKRVKRGDTLLAKGYYKDVPLAIEIKFDENDAPIIPQLYQRYDKPVDSEAERFVDNWAHLYADKLHDALIDLRAAYKEEAILPW